MDTLEKNVAALRQRLDEAAALVRQVIDRQEGEERSHGL